MEDHCCGAVGVPDAGDPDVGVDIGAAVVDVEIAFGAREAVEGVGGLPGPVARYGRGPGRELRFDVGGVVEDGN